jgi:hypothetical protein
MRRFTFHIRANRGLAGLGDASISLQPLQTPSPFESPANVNYVPDWYIQQQKQAGTALAPAVVPDLISPQTETPGGFVYQGGQLVGRDEVRANAGAGSSKWLSPFSFGPTKAVAPCPASGCPNSSGWEILGTVALHRPGCRGSRCYLDFQKVTD